MLALPTLLLSLRAPSLQPEGQPTPAAGRMILLSRGRGGSTVTCAVFAQLAHSPVWNLCTELFGSRLDQMANVTDPRATMIHWFNEQQVAQPHAQLGERTGRLHRSRRQPRGDHYPGEATRNAGDVSWWQRVGRRH